MPGISTSRTSVISRKNRSSVPPVPPTPPWDPSTPLGGEMPSYWYQGGTRSGLILPNAMSPGTGDKTILLPHINTSGSNGYAYVNDNGSMDIINNLGKNPLAAQPDDLGFTLCGFYNNELASKAAYKYLGGKNVNGSVNGRYGFYSNITTGVIVCSLQSSGGNATITSAIDFTAVTWPFLLMDVNYTTHKLRLFIKLAGGNLTQIGSDTSFTGTLAQLGDAYRFYLNACNALTTGAASFLAKVSSRDVQIFNKILTPTEQTTVSTGGFVPGAVNFYPCNDLPLVDIGTAGKHLTGTNLVRSDIKYDIYGSRQLLDYGYTKFVNFPNKEVHVAYRDVNTPALSVLAGYTKDSDNPGIATEHNGCDSAIPVTDVDRSNTTNCSYLARATTLQHYYDSVNVSYLNVFELNNKDISNYFTDNFRGLYAAKKTGNILSGFVRYTTNKTGDDYKKLIKWTTEPNVLTFEAITGPHICAVNGLKVLKFDDVHSFSLSIDGGATYGTPLLTTLSLCDFAAICDDGSIGFADSTKMYYSDDNLASYHESTVTGADDNAFVAGTLQNFRKWANDCKEITLKGVKQFVWGNYTTSGTAEKDNINLWHTKDGFKNVKSSYLFGVTAPVEVCRHIHNVTQFGDDILISTGDDLSDGQDRDNTMQFSYDADTDLFTGTLLGKGGANTIWEGVGIAYKAPYIYTSGEDAAAYKGIRRILGSDIANLATNQVRIFIPNKSSVWFGGVGDYLILCEGGTLGSNDVTFSLDGIRFFTRSFTELTVLVPYGCYYCIGKLSNGYYVFQCIEAAETLANYPKGSTLLIKPTIIS